LYAANAAAQQSPGAAPDDRRLDSSGWIVPRRRRAGAALDYVGCGRWQPTAGTLAGR